MDLGLKDKIAVVAAASQGLGKACALALAQEGAKLVICSRRKKEITEAAEEIEGSTGSRVVPIEADMSKQQDITRFVDVAKREFGT
ncbi:MAG: SDR family NAD(P)-dependent oxidoreductase, partial [Bacteroidota bacterium]